MPDPRHPTAAPAPPDVTGVVLAGGGSRRMGRPKALVPVADRPLALHVAAQLRPFAARVLLSVAEPTPFAALGLPLVVDDRRGAGPLVGLLAGLRAATTPWVLFAPCDVPDLPPPLLRAVLAAAPPGDGAGLVDRAGRPEPLFAVYHARLAPVVADLLDRGERRARALWDAARIVRVPVPEGVSLTNLNTPADLAAWRRGGEGR